MTNTPDSTPSPDRLRAVVTGARPGIGAATARHFVETGWSVPAVAGTGWWPSAWFKLHATRCTAPRELPRGRGHHGPVVGGERP